MKAISLHQPWATLVALGEKTFETRSWWTGHRGPLAIHATKCKKYLHLRETEPFATALGDEELPLGVVVAVCNLHDVWPAAKMRLMLDSGLTGRGENDLAFGDFSPGRYAWELELVERLDPPVPARGMQGLWWCFGLPDEVGLTLRATGVPE